jgi:hypothetical protein
MARRRRHWQSATAFVFIAFMLVMSARRAVRVENQRQAFERNVISALNACHAGNMERVARATSNAIALAPDPPSEAFVRDFLGRMRKGDCQLNAYVDPQDGYVPLHVAP